MKISHLAFGLSAALAIFVADAAITTVSAATSDDDRDARAYLALGDSVAFGYITQAGFAYINADNFVGYPAYIAQAKRFNKADATCPGETTGSFLSSAAADFGCRAFRSRAPLHGSYTSTQAEFAITFLNAHKETRLVTIALGANDLFLLETSCAGNPSCVVAGLPVALAKIGANMQSILAGLRATGFEGPIVVPNYYSLDYSDVARTRITQLLDQVLASAAAAQGAVVADVFTAFQAAASNSFAGGSPCRAGLLNAFPGNQLFCDIHPSQSGQRLIAETVVRAERAARRAMREGTN